MIMPWSRRDGQEMVKESLPSFFWRIDEGTDLVASRFGKNSSRILWNMHRNEVEAIKVERLSD